MTVAGVGTRAAPEVADRLDEVLDEVERRFATAGPRALVMSDLARSLGMSTKTLYRLVPSKEDLILAVVRRWSDGLLAAQDRRMHSDMSSQDLVRTAIHALVAHRRRFCAEFWQELAAEHPEAWSLHQETLGRARRRSEAWLASTRRPDVDPVVARHALVALVDLAQRPELLSASGMDVADAIDQIAGIWSRGVMVAPEEPPVTRGSRPGG